MALDHPARILVSDDGEVFIAVGAGSTPATPWGFVGMAVDGGGVVRATLTDTSGRQRIVGAAAAGAAAVGDPVQVAGKDSSGNLAVPLFDPFGGALATIAWGHYKVHAGKHFFIADWTSVSGAGTAYDLLLVTNGAFPHLTMVLSTQAAFTYELYESTTTSADGTSVTTRNNNRNSATAAAMTAFHTPTVTAVGTLIARRQLSVGAKEGGTDARENELILKTGTKYLLRFVKTDAGSSTVAWVLNWYE